MYKLTLVDEYCAMFPDDDDKLDFHVITARCARGYYNNSQVKGGSSTRDEGLLKLFADLQRMVANGKQFNEDNRDFQPWRLIDMMEKTILSLKNAIDTTFPPATRVQQKPMSQHTSLSQEVLDENEKSYCSPSTQMELDEV